jgi:hypothetical protein
MDADYSKREIDEHFRNINEKLDTNARVSNEIRALAMQTNGRVTRLENWRWYLAGIGTVIIIVLPLLTATFNTRIEGVEKQIAVTQK